MIALTTRGRVVSHWNLTTTNWEQSLKLILYGHTRSYWRTQRWPTVIRPLKPIGKVKKLDKWISHELTKYQKTKPLKCHVLFYNNNKTFLNQIETCNNSWTLYDNWRQPAQWLDWEEAPKHFPKSDLNQKRSWSLSGGPLLVWSTTAFWIPAKRSHLRTCSANQRDTLKTASPAANTGH